MFDVPRIMPLEDMGTFKTWAADLALKHPFRLIVGLAVTVFGSISLVRNFDYWTAYLTKFVELGVVAKPEDPTHVHPHAWFVWFIFLLGLAAMILGALAIHAEINRREAIKQKTDRTTKAFKTLQGMMRAASLIRDRTTPPSPSPRKSFERIKVIYKIHKDFAADLYREYHIKATDQPLHFWTTGNRATAYANPMDYLDDLEFKVKGDNDGEIVYLPTENDPLNKQVVIYFLPRIEPGDFRKVIVTYKWPGLLKQLDVLGEEDFNFTFESKATIPLIEIHFYLEPGTGRNFLCEVSGPNYEGATLEQKNHPELNWPGYIYKVQNAPQGTARYSITARLRQIGT